MLEEAFSWIVRGLLLAAILGLFRMNQKQTKQEERIERIEKYIDQHEKGSTKRDDDWRGEIRRLHDKVDAVVKSTANIEGRMAAQGG